MNLKNYIRFFDFALALKSYMALYFAAFTVIYAFTWFVRGEHSVTFGVIVQLLLFSLLLAGFQFAIFPNKMLSKKQTKSRALVFVITTVLLLIVAEIVFKWFAVVGIWWLLYGAISIILVLLMLLSMTCFTRGDSYELNEKLKVLQQQI